MKEKTVKETIIDRLIENKDITKEEGNMLLEKELVFIPNTPVIPQLPYQPYTQPLYPMPQINPQQKWISDELDRRADFARRCSCNPANGGSGICGCVMVGPIITC
jgi:hypothetical protein